MAVSLKKTTLIEFDESGEPVETSMKTWAGYAEENKEYNGRAYVYTPVLPESAERI